jgi:hypothetical protein
MDFWDTYEKERTEQGFGIGRKSISSRDRIHLSLSSVDEYCMDLEMNHATFKGFSEQERYVLCSEITHDLLLSIYDVNTERAILLRFAEPLSDEVLRKVGDEVRRLKRPNLEMRIIGLQDRDSFLLGTVDRLHNMFKSSLMEIDLFGNEIRHIAFDLKIGMSFNLLLLNRPYLQYELINKEMPENYEKRKSELKFI